jgi:hypothetical protein
MTLLDRVCVVLDAAQIPHALIGAGTAPIASTHG